MTARSLFVTLAITGLVATSADAQTTSPRLTELSPASRAELAADESRSGSLLQQPRRDSRWNGFLIGAIAGAVAGVTVGLGIKTYCDNEARDCGSAVPIVGGLGGLVGGFLGAAVDDAIGNSVMRPPRAPAAGVRFSVRF